MPRRARLTLAGVPHHVVQRGHNREATFFADEDYLAYRHSLKEGAQRYRCAIHAYALMTNHVHLLLTPASEDGLSRLMRHLGSRYVQYVNFVYKRRGTLWEGRYKSSLVDQEQYLLNKRYRSRILFGSERFRKQVEAALGKRAGLGPRGRREAEASGAVLPRQMGLGL